MSLKKVCVIGSGNWGSAIVRLVAQNISKHPESFDPVVKMWVFEEIVDGRKLTEIINTERVNVKYLPGRKLPENVLAVSDIVEVASDADYLIIVVPHQFIQATCSPLKGKLKSGAHGISLVKGFSLVPTGGIQLISDVISKHLEIPISVLMGANLAHEVADGHFCETTIGYSGGDLSVAATLKTMFNASTFRVVIVPDSTTVEVCGALKNIVACGAGFIDGLKYGDNTKAAVIRLGLMEMKAFTEEFYPSPNYSISTFMESCGIADLVTTCYGGRNRRISEAFARTGKNISELEKEMLGGQKLQGPESAAEVYFMLNRKQREDSYPIFTIIHKICIGEAKPADLIIALQNHPEHMD